MSGVQFKIRCTTIEATIVVGVKPILRKLYTGSEVIYGMVRTGSRLQRLRPSRLWKDSSEGAEDIEVGRRFHSTLYGGRKSERGQGVGSVPDAGVVLPWSLGQSGGRNSLG